LTVEESLEKNKMLGTSKMCGEGLGGGATDQRKKGEKLTEDKKSAGGKQRRSCNGKKLGKNKRDRGRESAGKSLETWFCGTLGKNTDKAEGRSTIGRGGAAIGGI